jgi:hypothetical protein
MTLALATLVLVAAVLLAVSAMLLVGRGVPEESAEELTQGMRRVPRSETGPPRC